MSEDHVSAEGSSSARVGEVAHKLIRRTHRVSCRTFPAEEKIYITLEGIRESVAAIPGESERH